MGLDYISDNWDDIYIQYIFEQNEYLFVSERIDAFFSKKRKFVFINELCFLTKEFNDYVIDKHGIEYFYQGLLHIAGYYISGTNKNRIRFNSGRIKKGWMSDRNRIKFLSFLENYKTD